VFTEAFQEHDGGYRLRVRVIAANAEVVEYVRLDAKNHPVDQPKAVPILGFIGQFVRD
jgi:hypothetical protein